MRKTLVLVALLFIMNQLCAQEAGTWRCAYGKAAAGAKSTVGDAAEDNYDVRYLKFDLNVSNASTYIAGNVTTNAVALTTMPSYVFELNDSLIIDSVIFNGVPVAATKAGDIRSVILSSPLPAATPFTAQVFYHGTPYVAATIFGGVGGINNIVSPSWHNRVTFTQSEAYHAKEWWPSKQSLHDKIDSVDMWLTVPDTLKAGSNGLLRAVTRTDASHLRYEWHEQYPIDYYLISLSVAKYVDYSYYMHFTGSYDSMLVQNYVYDNPFTLPFFQATIDSTGMMIDYFSNLYTRYPFWKEKYGHCMAPLSGGMEHQTMTTIGFFDAGIVAHELGHQWFGDNVTCGTWADIMCNEGFASYTEDIFLEHFHSHAEMVDDMRAKQADVRSEPGGSIYVDDTTVELRVFDGRLSYNKGACMLHMLRYLIDNDSTFFQVYKTYQTAFAGKTGTIADFESAAVSVLGRTVNGIRLDTFFNEWAYGQGFPIFNAKWNQGGSDVYVQLDQQTSDPSVPDFITPIDILLHSTSGDTLIRVNNDQPSQVYHFTWHKTVAGIALDPNSWLLDSVASVTHDTKLQAELAVAPGVTIYPNPSSNGWNVMNVQKGSALVLTDLAGRILWTVEATSKEERIPAAGLSKGMYILHVSGGKETGIYKLMKL